MSTIRTIKTGQKLLLNSVKTTSNFTENTKTIVSHVCTCIDSVCRTLKNYMIIQSCTTTVSKQVYILVHRTSISVDRPFFTDMYCPTSTNRHLLKLHAFDRLTLSQGSTHIQTSTCTCTYLTSHKADTSYKHFSCSKSIRLWNSGLTIYTLYM